MATYEVTVARDIFNDTVITSWSPSPTGNGTTGSRYEFESGDIIKFKKSGSDSVSVTPSSGFFSSNSTISLTTVFVSKTVQSTQANYTLSYSIFYSDGGGGFGGFGGGN